MTTSASNFAVLQQHDEQLLRLGRLAEHYFATDPNTAILKLRQFAELLAQHVATRVGLYTSSDEQQIDLLRRLQDRGILPREVAQLFAEVRRTGNAANHALTGDHTAALSTLKVARQLGLWFHRTFADPAYKGGPFVPPQPPRDESAELRTELERLSTELARYRADHRDATEQLESTRTALRQVQDERALWEQMAADADSARASVEARLVAQQANAAVTATSSAVSAMVEAAQTAATELTLDEASTRQIVDAQLRAAGWTVDTVRLNYRRGTRPEKGKNLAIAEWPTASGPADYVLFVGLTPIAAVEAKRANTDVAGVLTQAKRYSRTFAPAPGHECPGPWGEFHIPFVFSTNGRPYLQQIATKSGIWFCDVRRATNLSRALDGWYTPEGLVALLKKDEAAADARLKDEPFDYGFPLRPYQQAAIEATEAAIAAGTRSMLLAMATGTGKTKTCIALIYRLLKTQRFRRVLFLVDRSSLGEQAANAFKDTRMEGVQTFAEVFGLKELEDRAPDADTSVHVATVQGMVKRILNPSADDQAPPIDAYDAVIVDECHRGYTLDRELSDTELQFRDFDHYVSTYRRVLDYFDAVKVGLTATPALHTTQIFGAPIYSYSYREAVIDGFLVDHEPPVQITTELSSGGIVWKAGEQVPVYDSRRNQLNLFTTPDDIALDVDAFNSTVLTQAFNDTVCAYLATELDPQTDAKTLIFCVNDAHADTVVQAMKDAFRAQYGSVEDDAVEKITGRADKPLELIRRYKNERLPNVAVTVDLLSTGIDVPEISNLVFLRRVNSRILFDQMMGRATRLCDKIGKTSFRIFDAVRLYEALQAVTAMQPVVVNPLISFTQLADEMRQALTDEELSLVRDQFVAKLQRKKRHLSDRQAQDFETKAGVPVDVFIRQLRAMSLADVATWFTNSPGLGELLDRSDDGPGRTTYVSNHPDALVSAEQGYGTASKPEDYLEAFGRFVRDKSNGWPALMAVLTRPRELTRKDLREVILELDRNGYTEANLSQAWRKMTNQDIAARIVGYIRKAAIGDPLVPYDHRVDQALQKILGRKDWTKPQREWLAKIAAQTKTNLVVDRDAIDDPNLLFKRTGGGFDRINRVFGGELQQVLDDFHDAMWTQAS